jgi:hypothetical protein
MAEEPVDFPLRIRRLTRFLSAGLKAPVEKK